MISQKWEMVTQLLYRIELLKIMASKGQNLIKPHQGKDILKIDDGWKREIHYYLIMWTFLALLQIMVWPYNHEFMV